jgi:2,3-bisphosphoglycerate-independent phosphoglycerate mutase
MDRYNADWSIVQRGWDAHVRGIGRPFISAADAVQTFYNEDPEIIDQYLDPFVIVDNNNQPLGKILDGDSVIMFNFRGDRAIEISRAFGEKDFSEFDPRGHPDVLYAGMMEYDGDLHIPNNYLVSPPAIERTMSEYLAMKKSPASQFLKLRSTVTLLFLEWKPLWLPQQGSRNLCRNSFG